MGIVEQIVRKDKEKRERQWQARLRGATQRLKIILIFHPELVECGIHQKEDSIYLDIPDTVWIKVKGSVVPWFETHNGYRIVQTFNLEEAILIAHRALGVRNDR